MRLTGRWWRRRSLRARVTLAATAGLALALFGVALLLRAELRTSLSNGLDNTARQGAREVAALADAHRLPDPVPVAEGTITVQVLNARGRIVDASPGADLLVPLLPPGQAAANARTGRALVMAGPPRGLPGEIRVVTVATGGGETVIAAVAADQERNTVAALTRALLIGTPLLLLLLAGAIWLVVGTTLRPIAELRRGAQDVTRTGRPSALPVPEAHDEVHSLALTLNDMLSRLGQAQERQRGLVSDTAHELRSPIASIRAQLEVALDHPDSQDWRQTASDVLEDTLRLARLAEDLLVLARLDERDGRRHADLRVDLAALVGAEIGRHDGSRVPVVLAGPGQDSEGQVGRDQDRQDQTGQDQTGQDQTGQDQHRHERAGPDQMGQELYEVTGDTDGLCRMLGNLIDNAVRYARTRVTVGVTRDGSSVRLTVTDDGPGIPPGDRQRAFGRFARLDDARSRDGDGQGGAGLGLAIVRATAQAHGGSAWLEDAHPGLRAVVLIPAACPGAGVRPLAPGGMPAPPGQHAPS
jgi:signal transduction histidine kinase